MSYILFHIILQLHIILLKFLFISLSRNVIIIAEERQNLKLI